MPLSKANFLKRFIFLLSDFSFLRGSCIISIAMCRVYCTLGIVLRKNLNGFLSSKQPYGLDSPYPQMAKQTEAKRGSDLSKVPRLVSERVCACVTPELMVFLPVLHLFPDK